MAHFRTSCPDLGSSELLLTAVESGPRGFLLLALPLSQCFGSHISPGDDHFVLPRSPGARFASIPWSGPRKRGNPLFAEIPCLKFFESIIFDNFGSTRPKINRDLVISSARSRTWAAPEATCSLSHVSVVLPITTSSLIARCEKVGTGFSVKSRVSIF